MEKKVKSLKKKVRQSMDLQEKASKGETLNEDQMKKVEKLSNLEQELKEAEQLLCALAV
jgi:hypothetical protein